MSKGAVHRPECLEALRPSAGYGGSIDRRAFVLFRNAMHQDPLELPTRARIHGSVQFFPIRVVPFWQFYRRRKSAE